MKITDIKTVILQTELKKAVWSATALRSPSSVRAKTTRTLLLVYVHSSDGLVGVGQAYSGHIVGTTLPIKTAIDIDEVVRHYVVGQDPFLIEGIWEKAYQGTLEHGRWPWHWPSSRSSTQGF